jgi:DNA-directed RNA polymerase subunit H
MSNSLIPKHSKLSDSDKKQLIEKYSIALKQLPRVLLTDPSITKLGVKVGDIVKIDRDSKTAGKAVFYRAVVEK